MRAMPVIQQTRHVETLQILIQQDDDMNLA